MTDELFDRYMDEMLEVWLSRQPEEDVEFHPSPKFQRWIRKMIRQQRRSARANAAIRYAKRAAIVALAAALLTFGGFMTVEANRTRFVQVMTEVFEILTSYFYTSDAPDDVPLADVEFGWLPEGMEEVRRSESENKRYILFEDEDGNYIDYTQQRIVGEIGNGQIIDTEGAKVSNIMLNEMEAEVIIKRGEIWIRWTENDTVNLLSGNCSIDVLKKIGENIILT